ncbi:flagellar hook-length control protein FliK [Marinimicrobium sp. ARAG 43.8]|uniref:flagellar hook-length control protein FliK n=1 Tax=Marinimicrobium sp. ARAG 43.8 TaxID=3418719 RepID=UPI003CF1C22D
MPTQNSIADILSVGSRVDQHRPSARASDGGAAFQQAFRQSDPSQNRPVFKEPSAQKNGEPLAQNREPSARGREPSARGREPSKASSAHASDRQVHSRQEASPQRADAATANESQPGRADAPNEAVSKSAENTPVSDLDASAILQKLSDGEWENLNENIDAILSELKTALDAGELPQELTAALQDLLSDLESGAPLEDIIAGLDAIPIHSFPQLASQFPGAQTLKDVLGRSGAAYLAQLGAMLPTQQVSSERPSSASLLTVSQGADAEPSSLDQLLALNKTIASDPKAERGVLMEALLAKVSGENAKPHEATASSSQNVAATAQLEGGSRAQPLSPAERQFTIQSEVRVPVGQAQWGQAVGERVLWLASQKLGSAELRLDPPDLGPVHVRVSSHNDQISVTFTSPQTGVREALDQSANRLREMFSEQGLNLVDVNVSDQSGEQSLAEDGSRRGGGTSGSEEDSEPENGQVTVLRSNYLVDHYA